VYRLPWDIPWQRPLSARDLAPRLPKEAVATTAVATLDAHGNDRCCHVL